MGGEDSGPSVRGPETVCRCPPVRGGFHPEMSGFSRVLGEGAVLPFSLGNAPVCCEISPVSVTGDDQAE